MRPLSIALLSHMASTAAPTGAERSLALLAEGLAGRGHRVRVATPGPWALTERLRSRGVEVAVIPVRPCWLAYYHSPVPGVAIANWIRWRLPDRGRRRLTDWLRVDRPDVVHVNCLPHLSGARIAHGLGLPVVWHLREILPDGTRARWWASRLRRHAHTLVAVSEATAAWLRPLASSARIEVVHNGIEPAGEIPDRDAARARLRLPVPSEDCVVGLVGQLLPHKGVLDFVRAAHRAIEIEPSLRFLIAGGGPERFLAEVRREIATGAAGGRIHPVGPQPSGALPIAACDVVCLTTRTPDPLPRAVLEAMQAGRAVAATRSGGAPELIEHERSGLLLDPGEPDALASAMVRLGRDERLRERLGREASRRATEGFSLERHVERMERILSGAAT